jgi:hypothetical protein
LIAGSARREVLRFASTPDCLEIELMSHKDDKAKGQDSMAGGAEREPYVDEHKFAYTTAEGLRILPSDDPDAEEFYLGWEH